jgi:hypothetical protein
LEEERATWQACLLEIFARKLRRFPSAWPESAAALRIRESLFLPAKRGLGIGRRLPDFPAKRDDFGAKNGHFASKFQLCALIPLDLINGKAVEI